MGWDFAQIKAALHLCFTQQRLSDPRIYHWIGQFQGGHVQLVDLDCAPKRRTGRSRQNIRTVESLVAQDRRITLPRLQVQTGLSVTTLHRILTKDLHLSKRCAKYVPHMLTAQQMVRRTTICDFWTRLRINQPRLLKVAVTMDESWVYQYDPESKEQS